MVRLTEKITNKETGEILAYRTLPNVKDLKVVQQLWKYEDVGLSPEQVQQLKELNTPIRPELEADGYADGELVYDTWICPNCRTSYEVDYDRYFYCPNCGQKIKWSEE